MATRPIVSYDDIATPTTQRSLQSPAPKPQGPPPKKRKVNGTSRNTQFRAGKYPQHWDEPESNASRMRYDDGEGEAVTNAYAQSDLGDGEEEEEESRELTHQEVWDDSALIDAWNSAMAEYEAYHGKGGKWKEEPVKKSPLWYNIPPATRDEDSKGKARDPAASSAPVGASLSGNFSQVDHEHSAPFNLDTFVPARDTSLSVAQAATGSDYTTYALPEPGAIVSQDDAFSRACNAMYWSGYWTAVYHYHRAGEHKANGEEEDGEGENTGGGDQDEEMLPAQR